MSGTGDFVGQGAGAPLIPVLAVVGVGLIGGSFAAALKQAGQVGKVIGVGRRPETLARALALHLIDEILPVAQAVPQADLVLIAVPVGATQATLAAIGPHLRPGAIVTDAGSTKLDVVAAARSALGGRIGQFVPGHPIAGSERSGPDSANPALYAGRNVLLTPLPENRPQDVELVARAWQACGAIVKRIDADTHDTVLGSVSHVPHLLAFAYMAQVAQADDADLRLKIAGSGFRDFTRIAGGSADMWRDIFVANRDAILAETAEVRRVLAEFEEVIRHGDPARLKTMLEAVSHARQQWEETCHGAPGSTDTPE